jgi:hypothetical protein
MAELARLTGLNISTISRRLEVASKSYRDNEPRQKLTAQVLRSYETMRIDVIKTVSR